MNSLAFTSLDFIRNKLAKSEDILGDLKKMNVSNDVVYNLLMNRQREEKEKKLLNFIFSKFTIRDCERMIDAGETWLEWMFDAKLMEYEQTDIPEELQKILLNKEDEQVDFSGYEDTLFCNSGVMYDIHEMLEQNLETLDGYFLLKELSRYSLEFQKRFYNAFCDLQKNLVASISNEHLEFLCTLATHIQKHKIHHLDNELMTQGSVMSGFFLTSATEYETFNER